MLTIFDPSSMNRRAFLRIGSLGLGGLSLPSMFQPQAKAGGVVTSSRPVHEKSVILLFLHGGPSQIETFDPHMGSPVEIRSATGEVSTKIPGITFGGSFPKLAKLADRVSIVPAYVSGDGNHDIKPVASKDSSGANLGSVYSYVAGLNHPSTGMPSNVVLFPRAVDPSTGPGQMGFGNFSSTGSLGSATAPFVPGSEGSLQKDMKLKLSMTQLDDRRGLLKELDRAKETLAAASRDGIDSAREKAFNVILRGVGEAFDLTKENAKVVERFDTAPLVRPENIDKKWNNYKHYVDNAKSLGKLLLLARRLCERGCGFVTVTTNFVWDMHADVNNAPVAEGMRYTGTPLDHALSAFLEDLRQRGLDENILLVCCGEMGRTPKINKNGGRGSLGQPGPIAVGGRRAEDGTGDRAILAQRRRTKLGSDPQQAPHQHDHAHTVRCRPTSSNAEECRARS